MDGLISLVNRIQRACTALGDYGGDNALPTLWEALPSVAVVGGQVKGYSFSFSACLLISDLSHFLHIPIASSLPFSADLLKLISVILNKYFINSPRS